MRRISLEIIIVIVTLTFVFALAFSIDGTSVTKYDQSINWNNASRSLTFDLKAGQTVSGSLNKTGDTSGNWFWLLDPKGNELIAGPTDYKYEQKSVFFYFTANSNGEYYASIIELSPFGSHISYSYSISSIPILGLDPKFLIGLVLIIGVALSMINIFPNLLRKKKSTINK